MSQLWPAFAETPVFYLGDIDVSHAILLYTIRCEFRQNDVKILVLIRVKFWYGQCQLYKLSSEILDRVAKNRDCSQV